MSLGHYIPEDINLDDFCPVDHVARCQKCGRVRFVDELGLGTECGPDFSNDTLCAGRLVECHDHDAVLAAYKLGGEPAALEVIFDGCKACVYSQLYGGHVCVTHGA